jgi:formylglycine-generating enzyme
METRRALKHCSWLAALLAASCLVPVYTTELGNRPGGGGTGGTGGTHVGGGGTGGTHAGGGGTGGASTGGIGGTGGLGGCGVPPQFTLPPSCVPDRPCCQDVTCCNYLYLDGNSAGDPFYRGDANSGGGGPYPTTVDDFNLDNYEVTVGRFRAFINAYPAWHPPAPHVGDGAHTGIAYTGWGDPQVPTWDLPANVTDFTDGLKSCNAESTWRDLPGEGIPPGQENWPINCVTWYEAFAFCIWDGGYLPTEAEWEYAAAGGTQENIYPWGNDGTEPLPANYADAQVAGTQFMVVGSYITQGTGVRWAHEDLAGSMAEWVFDGYVQPFATNTCDNCAETTTVTDRGLRGGSYISHASELRAAFRGNSVPTYRYSWAGFRCARPTS